MGRQLFLCSLWVSVTAAISIGSYVHAATPQSTNYRFDESSIGVSGLGQSSSTNFRGETAAGNAAAGPSASTNFQTQAGTRTSPDPYLTVSIDSNNANFGSFSPSVASTAMANFSVINYTSYGYVVQIAGRPIKYDNHEIAAMGSNASSQPGIEQFGVNLVANTSPISFGANPNNGSFGFGSIAPNYSTPNQFRFVSGETVAQADKSSGKTSYTMSYLVNVSSLTPGGVYTGDQTLIVTGTY